jgi:two-component system, sensor histidine kinase and response regulator
MKTIHGLSKISLSNRISLLFIFFGILPVAVILGLFFYYLENDLENQSVRYLEHQAKSIRGVIFERLQMAENEIRFFLSNNASPVHDKDSPLSSKSSENKLKYLENLFRLDGQGAVLLLGSGSHTCDIPFRELNRIESQKPAILKRIRPAGEPHLWMAIRASNSAWLTGRINANYLWNEGGNFNLPFNTELCVVDEENVVLVASMPSPRYLIDALSRLDGGNRHSAFSWGDGKQEYVASAHSLFLSGGFLADHWKIILSHPKESILSSIHQYRLSILLLGFLIMLSVLLLSQVSIRRNLHPLKQLMARAKAIANEDFSSNIAIKGSPEFQELLDAFSDMSRKIENKVAERTSELKSANEDLSNEIIQRIRAEEGLRQAKDAAELATRAKSDFLARMSHEIRTPMNGVLGMAELLRETELTPKQRNIADTVWQSGKSLLELLNDILDFSKIESGRLKLEVIEFDLRKTIEDVVGLFAEPAHRKGLEFMCDIPKNVPTAIYGDSMRVRQIISNLIGNAIKFTQKGEVGFKVGVEKIQGDVVELLFEVWDTGIGISPKDQSVIFDSFSQADESTSRRFGGTGLGLAISKQLVEAMGGKIGVKSQIGKGSTFWFTALLKKQAGKIQEFPILPELKELRVLIAYDHAVNRRILQDQFLYWGIRSDSAENGDQALAMLRAAAQEGNPYQLALLDVQMADIKGVDLARMIQTDPTIAAVRRALITSIRMHRESEEVARVGIEYILNKPVRQSQLYDCLVTLVGPPFHSPSPQSSSKLVEEVPTDHFSARVLVAEDNLVNQAVAVGMLESLGCEVDVVNNGKEVLDALLRSSYDVVFTDCQMPEMDGWEATRIAREMEKEKKLGVGKDGQKAGRLIIIALTADALAGVREQCLAAGMDDYLSKPFTKDQLRDLLKVWLPKGNLGGNGSGAEQKKPGKEGAGIAVSPVGEKGPLDGKSLDQIRRLQQEGAPDLIGKVIQLYLTDAPRLKEGMEKAGLGRDGERLRKAAHAFKSSSANIGALGLADLCRELEQIGRHGNFENVEKVLSELEKEYDRVLKALQQEAGVEGK